MSNPATSGTAMSADSYYHRTEVSRHEYSTVLNVMTDELNELRVGCLQFGDRKHMLGDFVYVPEKFDFTTHDGMRKVLQAVGVQQPDLAFVFYSNHGITPPVQSNNGTFLDIEEWSNVQFHKSTKHAIGEEEQEISVNTPSPASTNVPSKQQSSPSSSIASKGSPQKCLPSSDTSATSIPDEKPAFRRNVCFDQLQLDELDIDVRAYADPTNPNDYINVRKNKSDVTNILKAIAEFSNTLFLLTRPFRGNEMSAIACDVAASSQQRTKALGLFYVDHEDFDGEFTVLKPSVTIETTSSQIDQILDDTDPKQFANARLGFTGIEKSVRVAIPSDVFQVETVPLGTAPTRAIKVHCDFTEDENRQSINNHNVAKVSAGLANECTHRLVFSSKYQRDRFQEAFTDFYTVGSFACGGTLAEMKATRMALENGKPLFILDGTGNVADIAKYFVKKNENNEVNDWAPRLPTTRFTNQATLHEGLALLHANRDMFPRYNPNACYVIGDQGHDISVHQVKDAATRIIAAVTDTDPYSAEQDERAIELSDELIMRSQNSKKQYYVQAVIIQVLIRIIIVATTTYTVLLAYCNDDDFNTGDGPDTCQEKYQEQLPVLNNIALAAPVVAGVLLTIEKTLTPQEKYSNLLLLQHRLESEKFKYRARAGIYSQPCTSCHHLSHRIRQDFINNVNCIYEEFIQSSQSAGMTISVAAKTGSLRARLARLLCRSTGRGRQEPQALDTEGGINASTYQTLRIRHRSPEFIEKYGILSTDDYFALRLVPMQKKMQDKLSSQIYWKNFLQLTVIFLVSGSTVFVAINLDYVVPVMLSLGAAAEALLAFFKLETKSSALHLTDANLDKIKLEAIGPSLLEKRMASMRSDLVERSEAWILSYYSHVANVTVTDRPAVGTSQSIR